MEAKIEKNAKIEAKIDATATHDTTNGKMQAKIDATATHDTTNGPNGGQNLCDCDA